MKGDKHGNSESTKGKQNRAYKSLIMIRLD
jgi:hypothetical protein